jgi:hypothetical protein
VHNTLITFAKLGMTGALDKQYSEKSPEDMFMEYIEEALNGVEKALNGAVSGHHSFKYPSALHTTLPIIPKMPHDAFKQVKTPTGTMFECSMCSKRFTRRSTNARDHWFEHWQIHAFSCDKCSKTFTRSSVYKRHIKRCTVVGNFTMTKSNNISLNVDRSGSFSAGGSLKNSNLHYPIAKCPPKINHDIITSENINVGQDEAQRRFNNSSLVSCTGYSPSKPRIIIPPNLFNELAIPETVKLVDHL